MINNNPFLEAIERIVSLDPVVFSSVYTSFITSCSALLMVSFYALCCSLYLGLYRGHFYFRLFLRYCIDAFLSVPTVLLGLLGYIMFSQQGLLPSYHLLYTRTGMSIVLAILAFPLLTSLLVTALENSQEDIVYTARTLGANSLQVIQTVLWEERHYIITAYITTFSRILSEVGIAMMVGGNIKEHTRTITTAIALETGKGNFSLGIALGLILLTISFLLMVCIHMLQHKSR